MTGNILTRHATRQKSSPDFCPYHDTKTEGCQDENINSPNLQNYLAFHLGTWHLGAISCVKWHNFCIVLFWFIQVREGKIAE